MTRQTPRCTRTEPLCPNTTLVRSKETVLGKPELSRLLKEAQSILLNGDGEMAADHEAIAREVIDEMSRGGDLRFTQGSFWQWGGSCFGQVDHDEVYEKVATGVKGNILSRRHNDYEAIVKTVGKLCRAELVQEFERSEEHTTELQSL